MRGLDHPRRSGSSCRRIFAGEALLSKRSGRDRPRRGGGDREPGDLRLVGCGNRATARLLRTRRAWFAAAHLAASALALSDAA